MFSFLTRTFDAFDQRKKQQEVWKSVGRIVDASATGSFQPENNARRDNRYTRCLPALLVPCTENGPEADQASFAVTKDLSDDGAAFLSREEITSPQITCAFWVDGPILFLCEVRQCRPFGGGFWHTGVRLCEVVDSKRMQALIPLIESLDPNAAS